MEICQEIGIWWIRSLLYWHENIGACLHVYVNTGLFGRLDLYLPKNTEGLKPVVAFVTGGAWTIG